MPPNFNDIPVPEQMNFEHRPKDQEIVPSTTNSGLKATRSLTAMVAQVLSGILTGVAILFAFRGGTLPINATSQHVVLCVFGYQFLMVQAILSLAPDSWTSSLNLKHRRWVHWGLQIIGSVLALAGCFVKIVDKSVHWNTLHGRFALVSMVFTSVSLVNGLASMYASQLRRGIPPMLSRLTHICFGIVAMATASIAFCYGMDKGGFRVWSSTQVADALIVLTGVMTTIVIINPFITFFNKLSTQFKS